MFLNQWPKPALAAAVGLALTVGLAGCGGGGTDVGGGDSPQPQGVSASGVGVITGFGSVKLDDDSIFSTDDRTQFTVDGVTFETEADFKAAFGGSDDVVGAVAVVRVRDNVSDDFSRGTAAEVAAHTAVKGPVTSVDPLRVLGQTVVVTGDTVLADIPAGGLAVGNEVEVYGFTRDDNVILASRLQRKSPGDMDEWKLTGFVTASQPELAIGSQVVFLNALERAPENCASGQPAVGNFVEIKANPAVQDGDGNTLSARRVECKRQGLIGELDDNVALRRVQGFVSAVNPDGSGFTIGGAGPEGQSVALTSNTTFRNGTLEDLFVGVKVEVTGRVTNGALTASRVSFREARVRIEAPLQAVSDGSLTVLGLNIHGSALLEDDDNVLTSGQVGHNIRMRGFVDRDGKVFATRIDDRGDGTRDLRLRGPVDAGSINTVAQTFRILDITVNPASRYQDSRGANEDAVITAAQFFSIVTDGQPVQVQGGSFSAGRITGPEEIELED